MNNSWLNILIVASALLCIVSVIRFLFYEEDKGLLLVSLASAINLGLALYQKKKRGK